jgi:molybdate transport system ATP-binding protein
MIELSVRKHLFSSNGHMQLDVSLGIKPGELITLYGPSGAGKTTLLKMLCGLVEPDEGTIRVSGEVWYDSTAGVNVKPQARNVGIVFQDYALFPNMTVRGNLEYALSKDQSPTVVDQLLELMELSSLAGKKPAVLSGGQQQRVALARAIVRQPKILLLDEPMSALDTNLRLKIQDYILRAHRLYNLTTILVSHDLIEVIRLSNYVYLMDNGQIVNQGAPTKVLPIAILRRMIEELPDAQ